MNTRYYLRLLRTLALATLTAAAVAACSDDNDDNDDNDGREPVTPDGGIPVTFTANINPGSDANPDTRTVLDSDGNGGFTVKWKGKNDYADNCDNIAIWAADVQGTLTNSGSPKYYIPATSGASSELVPKNDANKLTLSSSGDWTFTAIYGESGAGNGMTAAVLSPLAQSAPGNTEHIAENDFSVATATQTVAAENDEMPQSINLGFKHKLSALQLRITNQTGEALTVKEIRLSAAGGQMAYRRGYDVATGKWKADGEEKSDYLKLTASNFPALATGGASQDFHMLLFPGYENDTLTVTVITSRGEYSRTRPAPDGGFLAAKNYLTNIVIKTSGLDPDTETWVETISNKAELIAFRDKVNNGNTYDGKTVRLTADIDLTDEAWTPIGNGSNSFRGTFDGGGYHISKLSVDYGSNANAGLFGYISGGTVRNLRVSGTVKTTKSYVGGIAGFLSDNSTVENCIFDGDVSGSSNVGGIAGYSKTNSRIAGCHTKGKVTATASFSPNAGGIAGHNNGSTIDGCYSEAEVTTGYTNAGGIAGQNMNGGTITHCYATGKVSGIGSVGGIVGYNSYSTVTGCIALNLSLTRTSGSSTSFGRIAGGNDDGGTITSCGAFDGMTFTDGTTSQPFTGATGLAGDNLTHEQCLTPAAYTSRSFPVADATTPGWAFDATTPWTYLPWNTVFEDFPGITDPAQYRISVPAHLTSGGTN